MRISVKVVATGAIVVIPDLTPQTQYGELHERVALATGWRNFILSIGNADIVGDVTRNIDDYGIVDGDRLFLSGGEQTLAVPPVAIPTVPESVAQLAKAEVAPELASLKKSISVPDDEPMDEGDEAFVPQIDEFRNLLIRKLRNVMEDSQQMEDSLSSWTGNYSRGFEICFHGATTRGRSTKSGIIVQILSSPKSFEAVITTFLFKDGNRKIVTTFTATPSSFHDNITTGLAELILAVRTSSPTLPQVLLLPSVRDGILSYSSPITVSRLSLTNRAARSALTARDVDNTFWKRHLTRAFGIEATRNATAKGTSYRKAYLEAQENARKRRLDEYTVQQARDEARRQADALRDPRFMRPDSPSSRHPYHPNPDIEPFGPGAPDPLNPLRDPRFPEGGHQPRGPLGPLGPFGGGPRQPGHPDLDPFGDPFQGEMFPGRRGSGSRRPGDPFMRGGGSGSGFGGPFI